MMCHLFFGENEISVPATPLLLPLLSHTRSSKPFVIMENCKNVGLYCKLVWARIPDPGTDACGESFVIYLEGFFSLFFHDGK